MSHRTIELGLFGICIHDNGGGAAGITSRLHESGEENTLYDAAIDGIESLILAHHHAGVDVTTQAYKEGIEAAVEACANNL